MTAVHLSTIAALNLAGVPYRLHEHEPLVTVEDYARHAPFPLPQFLKTILFWLKGDRYVGAAVRGVDRVDYRLLAQALNVNRRSVRPLAPSAVSAALGVEMGGVGPILPNEDVSMFVDADLDPDLMVFCGSGRNTATLEIRLDHLVQVARARRVRLARGAGNA